MKNILFLCTGNSCRSQMAEGFGKFHKSDSFNFYSAGTLKHGLNPIAVEVMSEAGVDISKHKSKTLDELEGIKMDYIFTVCSDAHENCPYYPEGKVIHVGFDDPPRLAADLTDHKQITGIYKKVRDEIQNFVVNIEEFIK